MVSQTAPLLRDRFLQFFQADPEFDRFHRKLLHIGPQQTGSFRARCGRGLSDNRADAWPHFKKPFLLQLCDHPLRRIGVDFDGFA